MGEPGTYSEKLPCGGTLEVTTKGFQIRYYFPGPDARSNGTLVYVDGARIGEYIEAFKANWNTFKRLKSAIPPGGEFQQAGEMGMQIRIGKFFEGVCIQSYHMPLATPEAAKVVAESYEYAVKRAEQVQELLITL